MFEFEPFFRVWTRKFCFIKPIYKSIKYQIEEESLEEGKVISSTMDLGTFSKTQDERFSFFTKFDRKCRNDQILDCFRQTRGGQWSVDCDYRWFNNDYYEKRSLITSPYP